MLALPTQGVLFDLPPPMYQAEGITRKHQRTKQKITYSPLQGSLFEALNSSIVSGVKGAIATIENVVSDFAKIAKKRWSDAEILALSGLSREQFVDSLMDKTFEIHEWILTESLTTLRGMDNALDKIEVLEWIYAPDCIERLGRNSQGKSCVIKTHVNDIPFSFANCCRLLGISKDEFRETLLAYMTPEVRDQVKDYVKQLTGMQQVPVINHRIRYTLVQSTFKTFGIHRRVKTASFTKGQEDEKEII